jgi:hypothetical protein
MGLYVFSRPRSALDPTKDTIKITAGSFPLKIWKAKVAGAEAQSGYNVVLLARSTGGTSPAGSITPKPVGGSSVAGFTVTYGDTSAASLGDVLHRFTPNSNGGIDPETTMPGAEYSVPPGGQVSLRSEVGTANVVPNFLIEEITG